ncbi:hypothetical protein [Lentilactobacillus hilgardii]|uniref:hypothetical protein n=1 Tax=Lentilactobacillus hilgardii TaxID=1588 RepID=UPI0021C37974|nr:hypothetical protein [Lentilactobacillus hilgardii]MCP9332529.1 hypothetical protein [Lentilactobacillus hilgardii]MCP9349136.1 hypothetical protein [Lentilactobacillus hilgardii]MCP9352004.1 hypothetical protein [Lentilactobacillus hilgardii]
MSLLKTIYEQLRSAQIDERLINAFQKNSDIVYTGVIQYLDAQDFVMLTYNDYGIQDGEVYLKISSVKSIETDSYDLASMKDRISFDEMNDLSRNPSFDMPIKMSDSLFDRIVKTLYEEQRVSLIITVEDGKLKYSEGLVKDVRADGLTFLNLNKFDFSKQRMMDFLFDDIHGIEFGGTELQLVQETLAMIKPENHIDDVSVRDTDKFRETIGKLRGTNKAIIIDTNDERKYFYVGQVIAGNANELVMMVVDMNGRFGGYVWIRYDDIKEILLDSDYLRLIHRFVKLNKDTKHFVLPVLNAERAFDDTDNILTHILYQSIKFRKIIRFELADKENFAAFPTNLNLTTGLLTVELLDVDEQTESTTKQIGIESIREMAFDYFKAFLLENQVD